MNSSVVNNTTTNKPIASNTSDVPWITGLTIGGVAVICILFSVGYYFNRKRKCLKRKAKTRKRESLTDVFTIAISSEKIITPNLHPTEQPESVVISVPRSVNYRVEEKHQSHTHRIVPDYEPSSILPPTRPIHTETDHFTEEYLRTPTTDHSFKYRIDSIPLSSVRSSSTEPSIRSDDDDCSTPDDSFTHDFYPIEPPPSLPTPKRPKKVHIEDDHSGISKAVPTPLKPITPDRCPRDICKQYSIDLRMNRAYFSFQHNKCYCLQCYPIAKTDHFTAAGSIYTVPRGWVRVGLHIDQVSADAKQIFKLWYTTFYGTSRDKLELILQERFIPSPGDSLLSGGTFTTHLPDKHHVYTSPSIHYASLRHVCPTRTTKINSQWYDVQVVLECKQNPTGIIKQRGYRSNVCRIIPNDEIEWKTNQRSSIVPYGLLIRARKHRCNSKCASKHSS